MTDSRALGAIISGPELDQMEIPPLHWIVYGLIAEGLTLLVAPPKAGKSWLVYAIALARARGGDVLGLPINSGPVLYLALEDGWRRLQERGRTLLNAGESLPSGIDYIIRLDPAQSVLTTISDWMAQHRGQHPLVIVDTFGKIKPSARPGASAYEHDYAVMGALKALVDNDPGSGMILVHHDRKATSDDFLDSVSGTNGIAGAADTTIVIRRARTEGEAVISVTGRDVAEREYGATFTGGAWSLVGGDLEKAQEAVLVAKATTNLAEQSAAIVQFIYQHPDGSTPAQINAALNIGTGLGVYLRRLVDSERVAKAARGLYVPVITVRSVSSDESTDPLTNTNNGNNRGYGSICTGCGYELDPVIVADGFTTHPNCDPT